MLRYLLCNIIELYRLDLYSQICGTEKVGYISLIRNSLVDHQTDVKQIAHFQYDQAEFVEI